MLCGRERQGLTVPSLNVVLVGQEDPEHENLGMRYVALDFLAEVLLATGLFVLVKQLRGPTFK
jgi:hypothetical protein